MPWWGWLVVWVALSIVLAPVIGRMLRRSRERYEAQEREYLDHLEAEHREDQDHG
jgi:hypothetical protein